MAITFGRSLLIWATRTSSLLRCILCPSSARHHYLTAVSRRKSLNSRDVIRTHRVLVLVLPLAVILVLVHEIVIVFENRWTCIGLVSVSFASWIGRHHVLNAAYLFKRRRVFGILVPAEEKDRILVVLNGRRDSRALHALPN